MRSIPSNILDGASEASADQGLVTDSTNQNPWFSTTVARLKRMRRNVLGAANLIQGRFNSWRGGFRHRVLFLTLTYRPDVDPDPRHMARTWDLYRKWCKRIGIDPLYVWVAELHRSGRVHYHAILWVPHGVRVPFFDTYRVVGAAPAGGVGPRLMTAWWPNGWANMKPSHNPAGYLAKYASKTGRTVADHDVSFPRGLRIYGCGGLDEAQRQIKQFINRPAWLAAGTRPEDRLKRVQGGGWIDRDTLDFWPSPWKLGRIAKVGGRSFVTLIPALPEDCELCFS